MTTKTTTPTLIDAARDRQRAKRDALLQDDAYAHRWLCHPERECEDGCDTPAIPERLAIYNGGTNGNA